MKPRSLFVALAFALAATACDDAQSPTAPDLGEPAEVDEHLGRFGAAGDITLMTQNLYVGTDVDEVITALATPDPDDDIPALLTAVATLERTDFPARARALAREIQRRRPEVIGLQEVSVIAVDIPPLGVSVHLDFLQILQDALRAQGLDYEVAGQSENFTAAPAPGISLSDLDVILVDRRRVQVTAASGHIFAANLGEVAPGVVLQRGWVRVDATIGERPYTFVSTHTEGTGPDELLTELHRLQVGELVASLGTTVPAVVMGDLNTTPGSPAYEVLRGAEFVDLWAAFHPGARGYTCCHLADLSNLRAVFDERIDYIWTRGMGDARGRGMVLGRMTLFGNTPSERVRNSAGQSIWPSDHAGLIANVLLLRRPHP